MKLNLVILVIVVLSATAEEDNVRDKRTLDKLLHHFVPHKPAPKPKPLPLPSFSLNTLWQGLQKQSGGVPLIQIQLRPAKPLIQPVFQIAPPAPALPPQQLPQQPPQQQLPIPQQQLPIPQPQPLQKFGQLPSQAPPPAPQFQLAPLPIQAPIQPALPAPQPTPAAFGLGKLLQPLGLNFGQQQQQPQALPPAPAPQPFNPVQPAANPVKVTVNVNSHGSSLDNGHGPIEVAHTSGFKKEFIVDKKIIPVDQSINRFTSVSYPSKHGHGHQHQDINVFNKHVDVFGAQSYKNVAPATHFSSLSTHEKKVPHFANIDHGHQSHSSVAFNQKSPVFSTSYHDSSFDNSHNLQHHQQAEKTVYVEQPEPTVITTYQMADSDCGSDGHNHGNAYHQHQIIGSSFGEHDIAHHRHY